MLSKSKPIPVIFLVMEFPPLNSAGMYRPLKFVKYLNQFGIEPIVVTFKSEEMASLFHGNIDENLLNEIPDNTAVYRIHSDDGKKYYRTRLTSFINIYFSIKDTLAIQWEKHLFKELDQIISKHNPKALFTTLPPFSSGMLAVAISRKYKLPLVTDMRDAWALWGYMPLGTRIHFHLIINEEKKIFKHSSAIIGVTPQIIRGFKNSHPEIEPHKFHYISNGFDGNKGIAHTIHFAANKTSVSIGYVGSFYYDPSARQSIFTKWWKRRYHRKLQYRAIKEDWLYRSPYFFFKTLYSVFQQYPSLKSIIKFEFVGKKPDWFEVMIKEFGLEQNVIIHGYVSHEQAILIQKGFDLILATSEKVIGGEHYCLPSKLFDSIGLNIPLIGFVTEGIQKEFIEKSGLGIICDPDNIPKTVDIFIDLLCNGKTFTLNREYINLFHRKNLTAKLATVFEKTALN